MSGSFTVETEAGTGSFTPELSVAPGAGETVVTVSAQDAQALAAAYVHLKYDARRYTPESVELSTFLGKPEEVLALALTDQAGEVPVGLAQIPSTGVLPRTGNGVLAVVHFSHKAFVAGRSVSGAPAGTRNKVTDLAIVAQANNQATLQWTERNVGDYDNNGIVGITDLTPLAILFGQDVVGSADPVWTALVDGNGDGSISLADLTPIGQNFADRCDGYILYIDANANTGYDTSGIHAPRPSLASINRKAPVPYEFIADYADGETPDYSVRPVLASDVNHPGPDSNHVNLMVDEPGAPEPPTSVAAAGGVAIGERIVHVTWTPSTSGDVVSYELFRKPNTSSTWTKVTDLSTSVTEYYDNDPTFIEQQYDYRMLARDIADQTSAWSAVATVTPYIPPTLDAPINVVAEPSSGQTQAIDVSWDKPANNYGTGFRVYCQAPGAGSFSVVSGVIAFDANPLKFTHPGLTEGQTYQYYVVTLNGTEESPQSSIVNSIPSTAVLPISIESISTDKTTHANSGAEDSAQLTVVCSPNTPDSVEWTGPGVFSNTSDQNPTWKPNGSTPRGKVTLTVTVTLGANNDSETIDMFVTGESIKTSFLGRDGTTRPVGNPAGSGSFTDTSLTVTDYLQPLIDGGSITPGVGMLREATDGHVILFDEWELWCGPCKAEFPDLDDYGETYLSYGFKFIACSSDPAPYGINDIKAWFGANGIDYCHDYHGNIYANTWAKLGADGYIPFNVLVDRDGMVRKVGGQANGADWETAIQELCGAI